MAINVGGFFANLSLKSDKASFDESKKQLKGVEDQTKKTGIEFDTFTKNAIKGLVALGAAAMGSAYAVSNIQAKMELTATKAGMGYTEFNKFSSALKLVGVDSANVAGKMANVNSALNDFKVGKNSEALSGLAKNLALMGIDLKTFAGLTPTQQIEMIARKAEEAKGTESEVGMRDLADEIAGLGDVLMATQQGGSEYKNFAELLAAGASATWSSSQSDVTKNSQAFNSLTLQIEQMWKTFGEKMGNTFRPMINDIADFIESHKDEITGFFNDVSELLLNLAKVLSPVIKSIGSVVADLVSEVSANVVVSEFEKTNPEAYKKIKEASKKAGYKEYSFVENVLDVTNKKANETQAAIEFQAMAIRLSGQAYTEAPTTAERAALGNPNATSIVFNGVTISGQDFNKVANYMSEHPGVDVKEVVKAVMVMAGTK
jgi:hypothetical protein